MARKLKANVVVGGVSYPAGSTPPKEVADRITNPKAWGDDPDADGDGDTATTPAKKATAKRSSSKSN